MVLAEARFATQPCHIAIGLPRVELPGVDDVVPLRFQESIAEAMRRPGLGGFANQYSDRFVSGHARRAEGVLVQLGGDLIDRVDDDPLRQLRLARSQSAEFDPQRAREGVAEGREQHSRIGIGPREVRGSVQRDHRLAGAGRAGDARRAVEVPLDDRLLCGVQEDRPPLPRIVERAGQLFHVRHHAEAALRVGMLERVVVLGRCTDGVGLPPVASSRSASDASLGR